MDARTKVSLISAIAMVGFLAILLGIWWMNGRDQTLIYATFGLVVVTSFLPIFFRRKNKDQ